MPKGVYLRKLRAPKQYASSLVDRVSALYTSGKTQSEIGLIVCLSQKVIFTLMRHHGIAARVAMPRNQTGQNNANWRGKDAGYPAFHRRLYAKFGKPCRCDECGTTTARHYDYANLTGNYADITDYKPMCRSCHWRFDGKINNILKNRKGGNHAN